MATVKDLPKCEQPREKLLHLGPQALSDSELLAILLRTGTRGKSVKDVALELINENRNLTKLSTRSVNEIKKTIGIGTTKAVTLIAAFELAKRVRAEASNVWDRKISNPSHVAEFFIPYYSAKSIEEFLVVCLSSSNQLIEYRVITKGILDSSLVHPREVFQFAIEQSAKSVILLHNHPSGNVEPSQSDIDITKKLIEAGKILGIEVLDHIIVAGSTYRSFKESHLL